MLEKLYVELLYIHLLTLSIFRVVSEIDTAFTVRKSHINLDCKFGEQFIFPVHSTLLSKLFQTSDPRLRQTANVNLYHVTKFPPYFSFTVYCFYTKISRFMLVLSTRIVLDCFYLLIFYFEKFSTDVYRLPYAVNVNLNLSNIWMKVLFAHSRALSFKKRSRFLHMIVSDCTAELRYNEP